VSARHLAHLRSNQAHVCIRTTGSIILNLAYGYQTKEHDDPFVKRAEDVSAQLSSVIKSGAFLVDSIHWRTCLRSDTR
jgi:hypothetical protein